LSIKSSHIGQLEGCNSGDKSFAARAGGLNLVEEGLKITCRRDRVRVQVDGRALDRSRERRTARLEGRVA
jgi:hypothetical protein